MNGQDYLRRQSHVAIPFLYHNHIHNTSQHITTQHTNKTCPVCCVLLLHNIQIFPHHQTMNEPQVLQLWSKRGLEPRLRKKISLFYSYIKQPYKKTHREIERERERERERGLSIKSLHRLSLKSLRVSFMISGPPSSICTDQDLIPFPYYTFSTKVSFLPSPQKNSDSLLLFKLSFPWNGTCFQGNPFFFCSFSLWEFSLIFFIVGFISLCFFSIWVKEKKNSWISNAFVLFLFFYFNIS